MHSPFDPISKSYFPLKPQLPDDFRGRILRGCMMSSYSSSGSQIILQTVEQPEFSLQFSIIRFFSAIRMVVGEPAFKAGSLLAYKGNIHLQEAGQIEQELPEGHFSFLPPESKEISFSFEPDEQQLLEVSWCAEMLAEAMPHFPLLRNLFASKKKQAVHEPFHGPARYAGLPALELVNTLFKSPFDEELTNIYFQYRVRDYLLFLLNTYNGDKKIKIRLSQGEIRILEELRLRLIKNPRAKFPIRALAAETGMSSMKLKLGFKQQYREGIFNFHMISRMEEARRLLEEGILPTKAVAREVGYIRTTNFITQFRKVFGYPPSEVQKKQ